MQFLRSPTLFLLATITGLGCVVSEVHTDDDAHSGESVSDAGDFDAEVRDVGALEENDTRENDPPDSDAFNGPDPPSHDVRGPDTEDARDATPPHDTTPPDLDAIVDTVDDVVEVASVEVLVMFLDTNFDYATPVDILLNGERHRFFGLEQGDTVWESSLLNARGVVIEVDGPLHTVAFDPEQIHVDGLNIHGFGLFNYVVQKRHPDARIHELSLDSESLEHWSTAYDGFQIQWSRLGWSDGVNEVLESNPEFYELSLSPSWSDTGKVSILVGGRGRHHPGYGPDEHPGDDSTDPDPDPDPDPGPAPFEHPESPVLVPASVQVAVTFLDGDFFDVALNGQIYHFAGRSPDDPAWDYAFGNARGQVILLDHQLATMALDPNQVRVPGINNEGFGALAYKVVNKNADANLYATNGNHDENPEFWGNAAVDSPLGIIVSRVGNTITGTEFPDPLFYFGLLDQTTGSRVFHPSWSATGKVGISFLSYGQNSDNPVPGLEAPWFE